MSLRPAFVDSATRSVKNRAARSSPGVEIVSSPAAAGWQFGPEWMASTRGRARRRREGGIGQGAQPGTDRDTREVIELEHFFRRANHQFRLRHVDERRVAHGSPASEASTTCAMFTSSVAVPVST